MNREALCNVWSPSSTFKGLYAEKDISPRGFHVVLVCHHHKNLLHIHDMTCTPFFCSKRAAGPSALALQKEPPTNKTNNVMAILKQKSFTMEKLRGQLKKMHQLDLVFIEGILETLSL